MQREAESGNTIQALERAFEIVETLREHEGLTLTELSELLELPTSTAHVYLKTLEKEGFVTRENRTYRNGLKFLEYGGYARRQYELYSAARPVLMELANQTGERAGQVSKKTASGSSLASRTGRQR
ncbi:helix-turn-helix domain-containing protein [Saliphagus sp. GCM10025308]